MKNGKAFQSTGERLMVDRLRRLTDDLFQIDPANLTDLMKQHAALKGRQGIARTTSLGRSQALSLYELTISEIINHKFYNKLTKLE